MTTNKKGISNENAKYKWHTRKWKRVSTSSLLYTIDILYCDVIALYSNHWFQRDLYTLGKSHDKSRCGCILPPSRL